MPIYPNLIQLLKKKKKIVELRSLQFPQFFFDNPSIFWFVYALRQELPVNVCSLHAAAWQREEFISYNHMDLANTAYTEGLGKMVLKLVWVCRKRRIKIIS